MSGGAAGVFYDGVAAKPRPVTLRFGAEALEILEGEATAARWPYPDIRRLPAAASRLRLRSLGGPALARLDVDDAAAAAELLRRSAQAEEGTTDRRTVARIVGWSLAATASLVLTAIYLVPLAADELAPLVPVGLERRIGEAVDNQVRTLFGGKACAGAPGSAALAKLSAALASRAALPLPAEVSVLDSGIPNAVALPGGRVYLFEGLLRRAREPDEIAGILAHELGHVARRDGMRKLIQTGGSSFLLGLLFGDITGGGTLIFLGRALVDSSLFARRRDRRRPLRGRHHGRARPLAAADGSFPRAHHRRPEGHAAAVSGEPPGQRRAARGARGARGRGNRAAAPHRARVARPQKHL